MRLTLLMIGSLCLSAGAWAGIADPVHIETGMISGAASSDGAVRVFKGIPYAAPPVGDLRWRPPQPAASWEGVRPMERFRSVCMQNQQPGAPGPAPSEDCLYLNVWTAARSAEERRPVIVWSYGGGFYLGSGSQPNYDGEALARKGAVVVTYNYRLGVLGFFSHPELTRESGHRASGNYGMMDFIEALRWVRKNIAAFGGDPDRVTIDGESAGAILVAAGVGSPEGKGLFQRAIAQSGAFMGISISRMTTLEEAEAAGTKLAAELEAPTLAQLRAKPAAEFLHKAQSAKLIVDGWYIPEDLSAIFTAGKQNAVDILAGSNQDEGTFFLRPGTLTANEYLKEIHARFGELSGSYLSVHPADSDAQAEASRLAAIRDELAWNMRTWARLQTKRGNKAYLYYFTQIPPAAPGQATRGATHTAEIRYMFDNLDARAPLTEADRKLADTMSSYWVNFAASGDPNGPGLPRWAPYDADNNPQPMVLGGPVSAGKAVDPQALAFFDRFFEKERSGR